MGEVLDDMRINREIDREGKRLQQLAKKDGEIERLQGYLVRIIQVRGGHGMFERKEALDEMARLAGEALTSPGSDGDA